MEGAVPRRTTELRCNGSDGGEGVRRAGEEFHSAFARGATGEPYKKSGFDPTHNGGIIGMELK